MKLSYSWLQEYIDINNDVLNTSDALTMAGSEVGEIIDFDNGRDKVLDMEITSNRPDCLNMLGLAREVSSVFDKDMRIPDFPREINHKKSGLNIKSTIKNKDGCPFYTARIIKNVNVASESTFFSEKIEPIGLRPVNNIVDITNFCLLESGQPMHAFDLDKVRGGKVIVRNAQKGEKIVTIDGVERELDDTMLVIADAERAIAVAGVMGGKETEVTDGTKNILFESAYFDPVSIRRTARKLGLSTDSSYRFERGVDKDNIEKASNRAALLIEEHAGGNICEILRVGKLDIAKTTVHLDTNTVSDVLGIDIDKERMINILCRLGFQINNDNGCDMEVEVPTFREDVTDTIDLVEEIARVYGYDNIPSTMPDIYPSASRKDKERTIFEKINDTLIASGFTEIMNYSLISEQAADIFNDIEKNRVALFNPLSEEHKILTPQLISGMLKSVSWNLNRKNNDLMFFEIGKIYREDEDGAGYAEIPVLCMGATGLLRSNWAENDRKINFFDIKGAIDNISRALDVGISYVSARSELFSPCSDIAIDGNICGFIGQVSEKVLRQFDIEQEVFVCQLELKEVLSSGSLEKKYTPVTKFPFSGRDISVLCGSDIYAESIIEIIRDTAGDLAKNIKLTDQYTGKNVPENKRSITFSILYGMDDRTMKDEEVEELHEKVRSELLKNLKISFR